MKMQVDEGKFDALQIEVGYAIAHEVHTALKKAGVPDGEQLEQIVADALFHIGCVIDGSAEVKGPDGPMQAILTFRRDHDDQTLLWAGGTSWIHEGAFGLAEEYFDRLRTKPVRLRPGPSRPEELRLNPLDRFLRMVREIAEAFTKP